MGVKKSVFVFGGGMGGLSAAHELTEGGRAAHFDVTVFERSDVHGGKAISETVPGIPPHANGYPGEHGFRFFPTFYRHIVDTMSRIPSRHPGRRTVADHLQSTPLRLIGRKGHAPIIMPAAPNFWSLSAVVRFLKALFGSNTGLKPDDMWHFAGKLTRVALSRRRQRLAELEGQSWWDFVEAECRSDAFKHYLASGLTRTLVAAKPKEINAMTGGQVLVRMLIDSGMVSAATDRVLDGPTSEVWIAQWLTELERRHVGFEQASLVSLALSGTGRIGGAIVECPDGTRKTVSADYYVLALPVEHAAEVLARSPDVVAAGERLSGIATLKDDVRSMTGVQFYLDGPLHDLPDDLGHGLYVDSEWALTSIAQSNFWRAPFDDLTRWGDGNVKTVFSTILSDWTTALPGGTCANHSTLEELRAGTIEQLVAGLNGDGTTRFDPASILAWNLDSSVTPGNSAQAATNLMPLLVNKPDRWKCRPDAAPKGIGNLMLAADYVRTGADLATMEAANEAARLAVNAILGQEGVTDICCTWDLYYPEAVWEDPVWAAAAAEVERNFQDGREWQPPEALERYWK